MSFIDKQIYSVNSLKGFYHVYDSTRGRYLTLNSRFIGLHPHHRNLKRTYFYDLISKLKQERNHIKQALVFGLGTNTLQNLIFKNFSEAKITTIENDPTLIDIYNYFFEIDKNTKQKLIVSDAFQFVKNYEQVFDFHNYFDLVVVDFNLLGSDFYSEVFLKEIKNFLKPHGTFVLVLNRGGGLQNTETMKFVERLSVYYNKINLLYSKSGILEVFCNDSK